MSKRDYYEVLGIGKSASADEIKKAFRHRYNLLIRLMSYVTMGSPRPVLASASVGLFKPKNSATLIDDRHLTCYYEGTSPRFGPSGALRGF